MWDVMMIQHDYYTVDKRRRRVTELAHAYTVRSVMAKCFYLKNETHQIII